MNFFLNIAVPLFPQLKSHLWFSLLAAASETVDAAEEAPLILAGVLLSLVVIYLASKVGGELCARLNLPPVLGELIGGVTVGISALHLLMFPEAGAVETTPALLTQLLQASTGSTPELAFSCLSSLQRSHFRPG